MRDAVTTVEDLDALPEGSVVLDARGIAHQLIEEFDNGPLHWRNPYNETRDWVRLPATLLIPEPSAVYPGPCMDRSPEFGSGWSASCELRAGHAGGHEKGSTSWRLAAPDGYTATPVYPLGYSRG